MRSPEANRNPMFRVPPFPAFPSVDRYIPVGTLRDSLNRVVRSIDAREALSLVIGPPGTGKSLLIQLVAKHFFGSRTVVQLGDAGLQSPEAFFRHVLHALGVDLNSLHAGDLHLALVDHVKQNAAVGHGLLLLIDEAQSLCTDVLESIRMATNIMVAGQPRVCAVLSGGPRLDETLATPSLDALSQRVATRCYLHPFNGEETREYVEQAIRSCGGQPEQTVTPEAIAAVHHAGAGIPRLVNQLMTQAIDCAESLGETLITDRIIDHAWATLQQLPSPIMDEPSMSAGDRADQTLSSNVEFGALSDLDAHDGMIETPKVQPQAEAASPCGAPECGDGVCRSQPCRNESNVADADSSLELELELDLEPEPVASVIMDDQPAESSCGSECDTACESSCDIVNTSSIVAGNVVVQNPYGDEVFNTDGGVVNVVGSCDIDLSSDAEVGPGNESTDIEPMMSEPVAADPTPEQSELFGDFEEEEELAVGVARRDAESAEAAATSDDLESSLQMEVSEIAGEAQAAADRQDDDMVEETIDVQSMDAGLRINAPEIVLSEDDLVDSGNDQVAPLSLHQPAATGAESPVAWFDEDESGNVTSRDDSDILVVEEDVPTEVPTAAAPVTLAAETKKDEPVAVDFQAMLAKMRGNG
ncbi:ExeA family protein [Crateriforma conspicua]|uniref:AAA+ ATPase domain-containing protein n=1 Tax=Crateriforma conspicua TaxID=2527996 RepID=A0A5C5Y334_9PLAN|nr:AAA family ATPase [Crateriforma conspicua]TWT67902.1 hypothetical protein Pan14r_01400 [Crateriforma conspicua]